jgi:photosystem II stability/assembly factor-like uncharacterized protein
MTVADTIIYVGTFEGGVFRTVNKNARAWRAVNTGLTSGRINAIATLGRQVIVGTSDSGIYVSNNKGGTWKKQNQGLLDINVKALVRSGNKIFAGTNGGGIFMSSDSGSTWKPMNNGLHTLEISSLFANDNVVYAGTEGRGIFSTINGGTSWVYTGLTDLSITSIAVAGSSIFASDGKVVFKSSIQNSSWSAFNKGLENLDINNLYTSNESVFASTNRGAYSVGDNAESWVSVDNELNTTPINAILAYDNKLYAGTANHGILSSPSINIKWTPLNTGFNNLKTYALYASGSLIITSTNKGLHLSKDIAASFVSINKGLTDSLHVTNVLFVGSKLYASTEFGGVFESADTGRSWTTANTGLSETRVKKIIATTKALYLATSSGKVFVSQLGTISWSETSVGLEAGRTVTAFATDGNTVFLGTAGTGVYINGPNNSWILSNLGLSNLNISSLVVMGTNVFAGTLGGGIYISDISNINWSTVNTGLPTMAIQSLGVAENKYILAGFRGGVYTSANAGTLWSKTEATEFIPPYANISNISFSTLRIFITTDNNSLYSNAKVEIEGYVTGINRERVSNHSIALYPNPSKGDFSVHSLNPLEKISEILIYDHLGKLKDTFPYNSENFHLNYTPGVYSILVQTPSGTVSTKLSIE